MAITLHPVAAQSTAADPQNLTTLPLAIVVHLEQVPKGPWPSRRQKVLTDFRFLDPPPRPQQTYRSNSIAEFKIFFIRDKWLSINLNAFQVLNGSVRKYIISIEMLPAY